MSLPTTVQSDPTSVKTSASFDWERPSKFETAPTDTQIGHFGSYLGSQGRNVDFASLLITLPPHSQQSFDNIQWIDPMTARNFQEPETSSPSILPEAFDHGPYPPINPNIPLQSRTGHVSLLPRPDNFVEFRGPELATTPAVPRRYSRAPSPECNLKIIFEDPPNSKSYSEKLIRTERERAQQKEDARRLKEIGGACISCYRSKKKCGLGNPCTLCKGSGKECVRKYPGSSSPSPSRSSRAQPSTPELFGESGSLPRLPSKHNSAGISCSLGPLDNPPTLDSSIPSARWGQWTTSNDGLDGIPPLSFSLDYDFSDADAGE